MRRALYWLVRLPLAWLVQSVAFGLEDVGAALHSAGRKLGDKAQQIEGEEP